MQMITWLMKSSVFYACRFESHCKYLLNQVVQLPKSVCLLWYFSGLAIFLEASVGFSFVQDISSFLSLSP